MRYLLYISTILQISWCVLAADDYNSAEHGTGKGKKNPDCKCGWTNKNKGRIFGGNEAGINEFPWMVGVKEASDGGPGCGGAIVSKRIVITAAHCTEPMRGGKIQVLVGEHDILDNKETSVTQLINVAKYIDHPEYDKTGNLDNDISILYLEKDIEMSDKVGPICLPVAQDSYIRQVVKVMGWGRVDTKTAHSRALKKVNLNVISLDVCAKVFGGIELKASKSNQICTLGQKKDSCEGDSGGPLVWNDPEMNLYVLIGLISYGSEVCGEPAPGVNTDIFFHKNWALETIKKLDSSQKLCQKQG